MVQYTVDEYRRKTIISFDNILNESRIISNTYSSNSSEFDRTYVHNDIENALSLYADTTELQLYGQDTMRYPDSILSRYTMLKQLYIQSIKITPGTSELLFSSNTLEELELYIVYDIENMGHMPNLNRLIIKYCTFDRLPDLSKYSKLQSVHLKHCIFTAQSAQSIDEQLQYYYEQGIKLNVRNVRDYNLTECQEYSL